MISAIDPANGAFKVPSKQDHALCPTVRGDSRAFTKYFAEDSAQTHPIEVE